MPFSGNWDQLNAAMNHRDDKYTNLSKEELKKLSREERRRYRIQNYSGRESYRNYKGKKPSYFEVIVMEFLCSVVGWLALSWCFFAIALGLLGYIGSNILVGTLIILGLTLFILWCIFRPLIKRLAFYRKLKRVCRKRGFRLRVINSPARFLRSFSNSVDFTLDTGKHMYDVMIMGAPRKHVRLRFEKPNEVKLVTGYVKSRLKLIIGLREHVKVKKYGFDASKNAEKVILLNPAPREMFYYDKRDDRVVMGGSGAEFFGYYAFTGRGFINHVLREAEK